MSRILILVLFIHFSLFSQKIPKLENWANDFTQTLNKEELFRLNNKLKAFEDSTSNQIVILIISSLEGNSIEELANEIFKFNQIGTKKNDNGVLILLSKNDKEIRIEVGYGLEHRLTDAISYSIIRNEMIPSFKENRYYDGLDAGVNSIFRAIEGEYTNNSTKKEKKDFWAIILLLIFIIILFNFFRNSYNRTFRIGRNFGGYSNPWRGGFSGGGFGGFSSGGFSGGGGISGGGGASGRW